MKDLSHFIFEQYIIIDVESGKLECHVKDTIYIVEGGSKLFTFTVKRDVDKDYEDGVSSMVDDKFKVGKFISRDSEIYGGSFFLKSIITTLRQKGING
ncbi:hypothetical protein MHB47_09015 [Staphylococcus sp. FSL K6-3157]|uniref:hypothetical protein n=1 Tax=Staphylococcus sp. FSL K6-3157 TaxID=2921490 RepID=UPI0030FA67C5